jgi:hypothetical protein
VRKELRTFLESLDQWEALTLSADFPDTSGKAPVR